METTLPTVGDNRGHHGEGSRIGSEIDRDVPAKLTPSVSGLPA